MKEEIKELEYELCRYQQAYQILMDYWDSYPDEAKDGINKELEGLGL